MIDETHKQYIYAFGWNYYNKFDMQKMQYTNTKILAPATGSFSYLKMDKRKNKRNILHDALKWAHKNNFNAVSVGYLTPHDPDNEHIQAIIRTTTAGVNNE